MSPTNTPDDIADNKTSAAKKGYSIWSLLVIMTLLAVWMAVPRRSEIFSLSNGGVAFYFVCHQLMLWMPLGVLLWRVTGARRGVLYSVLAIIAIFWGPGLAVGIERITRSNFYPTVTETVLKTVKLADAFEATYTWIYEAFRYGPTE